MSAIPGGAGPPEVTSVRINKSPSICVTPQHITRELLHAEGFTDVQYVTSQLNGFQTQLALANGAFDFVLDFAPKHVGAIDQGAGITILAGVHVGCFELFATEGIRSIADLRGKSVGVAALGSPQHMFLAPIAAHVGIDPSKDINWVVNPSVKPMQLFIDGKIDAFLGFRPSRRNCAPASRPRDRQQRRGPPLVAVFLLHAGGQREFVSRYPGRDQARGARHPQGCRSLRQRSGARGAATRRWRLHPALRLCAADTQRMPYDKWREYDAEDTVRFYALRLHEAGFIKSSPQKIIADGTDWRFLNELKRELKA